MKNVYYQGETISITVSNGDGIDLSNLDFDILVYHHIFRKDVVRLKKSDAQVIASSYVFTINYSQTNNFKIGNYDIEILLKKDNDTYRSIFKGENVFYIDFSNSKNTGTNILPNPNEPIS